MITEDGKVEFNETEQAVVDKIIGERLSREGIQDKNEIVDLLKEFGYEGTPAEIKFAVKQQAEEFKRQQVEAIEEEKLESLKEQAKEEGTTPQLLARIEKLEGKLSASDSERQAKEAVINQQIETEKMFNAQVKYFEETEETNDLAKLNENPKFIKFLQKQRPTGKPDFLVEVYKDFVDLVGSAEAEATAKIKANLDRSTSSGRSKGDASGGTYGLKESQIATCDEWNRKNPHMKMSYKEFSERN